MTALRTAKPEAPGVPPRGLLSAVDIAVSYGSKHVLDGVSVSLPEGRVTGIIGPNGSGKTTLIRALAALLTPGRGDVLLGGRPLREITVNERAKRIAYMPQAAERHPFTALELVLMGRYPHLGRFQLEGRSDRETALEAMERTGTAEFADRQMDTLSGGERQRVALARALAQKAPVLLLDEPTASLDLKHQILTMETVIEETRQRGVAAAVVMHDLSLAGRFCDTLYLLHRGRVLAEGAPWDTLTRQNLSTAFGVDVLVEPEPVTGRPAVMPLRVSGQAAVDGDAGERRVHLICGAGSGRELMHMLQSAGFAVSACVLGEGDTDREAAVRLGIEHISSPPFSPVTPEQDAAHRELVRAAGTVVVCDMAIGPGNLANLMAAGEAKRLVLIERPSPQEWDYTGGAASAVYSHLAKSGTVVGRDDVLSAVSDIT